MKRIIRENSNAEYHIRETATHYVGKSGTEYPIEEYANHGWGGIKRGFMDLPHDDYPYTLKWEITRIR